MIGRIAAIAGALMLAMAGLLIANLAIQVATDVSVCPDGTHATWSVDRQAYDRCVSHPGRDG